jgi:hypothetical protein
MKHFRHPSSLVSAVVAFSWFWTGLDLTIALTANNLLDLSVFGECVIHFTQMKDDWETVDHAEAIIHDQYQSSESLQHQLISVHNSSFDAMDPAGSLIQPAIGVKEKCTLNVLLGVDFDRGLSLYGIVTNSDYTYSSDPFSTYILILTSQLEYVYSEHWNVLPTRIFYFEFPSTYESSQVRPPFVQYYCALCAGPLLVKMPITPMLAFTSYLNLKSILVQQNILLQTSSVPGRYEFNSEQYRAFRESSSNQCGYGFMELLSKTTETNMTVIVEPDRSKYTFHSGYTGHVNMGVFYSVIRFRDTASSWYEENCKGHILYCTCKIKAQRNLIYEGWLGAFTPNVWLGVLIAILSFSFLFACKSSGITKPETKSAFCTQKCLFAPFFDVFSMFVRQGELKKSLLMLLVCFAAAIILCFYENFMTSATIIAPDPPNYHTLKSLMRDGYTVLYQASSVDDFTKHFLEKHLFDSGVAYKSKQLKGVNLTTFHLLKAMDTNKNYLSYYNVFSNTQSAIRLRQMQLYNKGCYCFILKHGFYEVPGYVRITHFLRFRFQRTLNRLQQNGLHHFYRKRCENIANALTETRIRRRIDADEFMSNNSASHLSTIFESNDYIGPPSLNIIFCSLGALCLSWILVFTLGELKLLIISFGWVKRLFDTKVIIIRN